MSSEGMKWARRQILPGRLKRLVDLLAVVADDHNLVTHSQEEMAARLGVVSRTVARSLADLEALGVIRRAMRRDARGGRAADCIELNTSEDFVLDRRAVEALLLRRTNQTKNHVQPDKMSGPSKNDNQKLKVSHGGVNPLGFVWSEAVSQKAGSNGDTALTMWPADHGRLSSWPAPGPEHAHDGPGDPQTPRTAGDGRA